MTNSIQILKILKEKQNKEPGCYMEKGEYIIKDGVILRVEEETMDEGLRVSLGIQLNKDREIEELVEARFEILRELEDLASSIVSEITNNDPCSFNYGMDTDHWGREIKFKVEVTDSLS